MGLNRVHCGIDWAVRERDWTETCTSIVRAERVRATRHERASLVCIRSGVGGA